MSLMLQDEQNLDQLYPAIYSFGQNITTGASSDSASGGGSDVSITLSHPRRRRKASPAVGVTQAIANFTKQASRYDANKLSSIFQKTTIIRAKIFDAIEFKKLQSFSYSTEGLINIRDWDVHEAQQEIHFYHEACKTAYLHGSLTLNNMDIVTEDLRRMIEAVQRLHEKSCFMSFLGGYPIRRGKKLKNGSLNVRVLMLPRDIALLEGALFNLIPWNKQFDARMLRETFQDMLNNPELIAYVAPERRAMWQTIISLIDAGIDDWQSLQAKIQALWNMDSFSRSEIWSLGFCMYQYLTDGRILNSFETSSSLDRTLCPGINHLLSNMLSRDSTTRPTLDGVLEHPFFKTFDDPYFQVDSRYLGIQESEVNIDWLDPLVNECTRLGYLEDLCSLLKMTRLEGTEEIDAGIVRLFMWLRDGRFQPSFVKLLIDCFKFYYAGNLMKIKSSLYPQISSQIPSKVILRSFDSDQTTTDDDRCPWSFIHDEDEEDSCEISPILAKLVDDVLQDDSHHWML
eukprot:Gregarina_sp_Poly_1__3149@NODE_1891_length_3131_cov_35_067232_g470_i1_p1_GENE_NODE_1891_length_3131_cov_35_067232_g470_i1NODE_1891_length_3131_cov_35_067232_g470_i1_p1_ORF_typecomplete_len513_score48_19Pkinase/PF00069_25/5_1e02Pkinase/PF00069_25/0_0006_NODE_1891_length_3131_cov_35_067232_g470_i14301968